MNDTAPPTDRQDADVIVIGAGAFGCNAAWHLRQRGVNVLVLEAMPAPATQATRAAAGFIANFATIHREDWEEVEWRMQQYGIEFYTRLANTCGHDIAFCACGIAYIYQTDEGWETVHPLIDRARKLGTPLEVLDRGRASDLLPQIEFDNVAGIIFDPQSIRIRAGDAIPALAAKMQADGVRFQFETTVEAFEQSDGHITGVRTNRGVIHSSKIIVAAGAWSRPLVEATGAVFRSDPLVVTRYVTRPLAGILPHMPMLIFSDSVHRFFIREESGGLLIGGVDEPPFPPDRYVDPASPPLADDLPHDQAYRMRDYIRTIEHVMPVLGDAEIDRIDAGLPNYSPDRHFIVDAVPESTGLYVMAACNEAGITHGPALGRHITELVLDGQTQLDRTRFAIDRNFPVEPESRGSSWSENW
jgi:glycine/D-amino acid oxidase-like deaminating enzyme